MSQITSFDMLWIVPLVNLSKICLRLCLSACLFKWIKVDKLDYFKKWNKCFRYGFLVRLEGKLRDGIFFCINKSDNYSVIWFWWKVPVCANDPLGPRGSAGPLTRSLVSYAASKFTSAAFSPWLLLKSRTSHHLERKNLMNFCTRI